MSRAKKVYAVLTVSPYNRAGRNRLAWSDPDNGRATFLLLLVVFFFSSSFFSLSFFDGR